jgi:diguanylate cyclase (GGDEF)-like protein
LHILVFALRCPACGESVWRSGIILSTYVMVLMVIFWVSARKIRVPDQRNWVNFCRSRCLGVVFSGWRHGDRPAAPPTSPLFAVSMIVGTMFLLRPHLSVSLFAIGYAAFFLMIGSGESSEVILSNRVNGLTAVAIGYGLSWTMWRHFTVEFKQRRQIEAQSEELERVNRELQNMAFTDSLTGLPNRRYFDQVMTRELSAIERGGPPASVIEFDLDHFKEINDTCGHEAGDEVLRQVAGLVSGAVRKADMFARYGGEEFILLLPGTALDGALEAAEKLRKRLEEHAFQIEGHQVRLTASFGVAELRGNPAVSFYRSVDHALYHAKQLGRNRVQASEPLVTPDMPTEA